MIIRKGDMFKREKESKKKSKLYKIIPVNIDK